MSKLFVTSARGDGTHIIVLCHPLWIYSSTNLSEIPTVASIMLTHGRQSSQLRRSMRCSMTYMRARSADNNRITHVLMKVACLKEIGSHSRSLLETNLVGDFLGCQSFCSRIASLFLVSSFVKRAHRVTFCQLKTVGCLGRGSHATYATTSAPRGGIVHFHCWV